MNHDNTRDQSGRPSKLDRTIRKYELGGLEAELLERRQGADGDSLRDIAQFFNQRVLRAALTSAGDTPLDGEVSNYYRLLTDDDVTQGMRVQARDKLERRGVDVEELESDFISYQTINRFFDAHPDYEPPAASRPSARETMTRLFKMQSRVVSVSESVLEQLRRAESLTLGEFDVYVTVSVVCNDCRSRRTLRELLRNDGCEC